MIAKILRSTIKITISWVLLTTAATAQIVPDTTLPDNSQVDNSVEGVDRITGGTTRGSNLFHSFQEFSVLNGRTAHFDNAVNIQNIFSRATGNSTSLIDGIIKASGTANLFLLNPNGIIFTKNARLDIGGSLIGTTAASIKLADGTEYSATNPNGQPLLTISIPIGLQFRATPGAIKVEGEGHSRITDENTGQILEVTAEGLEVKSGQV